MVMKLIQGPSLERLLQFSHLYPAQRVDESSARSPRPLGFGHRLQVLHRDLKTANILLDTSDARPHIYLSDFGLGKRPGLDRTLTASGISVGTPEYMAPEVAMGEPADQRADLYSMGVMIYEMLLGQLPFQGSSAQMTALAHSITRSPHPRLRRPDFRARSRRCCACPRQAPRRALPDRRRPAGQLFRDGPGA
jgi:serine/threonine protein kinase